MLHYLCLTYYTPKTSSKSVFNTPDIFPERAPLPSLYTSASVTHIVADLTEALQHLKTSSLIIHLGDNNNLALRQIAGIFNNTVT